MVMAAVQPAGGKTADTQALEALRLKWGGLYAVGYDPDLGWWATRNGQVGSLLAADDPGALDAAITDDYGPGR
jgi:hypothetical protein